MSLLEDIMCVRIAYGVLSAVVAGGLRVGEPGRGVKGIGGFDSGGAAGR